MTTIPLVTASALLCTLFIGCGIILATFLVLQWAKNLGAAARYNVWCMLLAVLLLLPGVSLASSMIRGAGTPPLAVAGNLGTSVIGNDSTLATHYRGHSLTRKEALIQYQRTPTMRDSITEWSIALGRIRLASIMALLFTGVWFVGALFLLYKLLRATLRLRDLKCHCAQTTFRNGLPRSARILYADQCDVPFSVGLFHPAIILPRGAETLLSRQEYEEVILHEAAHLRRFDDWTALLYRFCGALFWVNPLMHMVGREMGRDREFACDDIVVAQTGKPRRYAATIWRFAEKSVPAVSSAVGFDDKPSQLRARLTRLMISRENEQQHGYASRVIVACSALLAAFALLASGVSAFPAYITAPWFGERPANSSFMPLSGMSVPRSDHTSTLLQSGDVLVAGGTADNSFEKTLSSAELYDPISRRFFTTGSMNIPRSGATATMLRDGNVLVTGGLTRNGTTSSAEIYGSASGTFRLVASMQAPRFHHSASLLRDGRVLIAGGETRDGRDTASAELYEPVTQTFHLVGSMRRARAGQASVVLQDGRVLIVGASDVNAAAGLAELFDPATGGFSLHELRMTTPRRAPAVLALGNGKALVVGGGFDDNVSHTKPSSEVFNASSGAFTLSGYMRSMRFAVGSSSVMLPSGDALVAGGGSGAELFHPSTGKFHAVPGSLGMERERDAVTVLADGSVLVTGGYAIHHRSTVTTNTAVLYRP